MKFKNQSFYQSIKNALRGIKVSIASERNLKMQLMILMLVLILGWLLKFSAIDWAIIVLTSVSVLAVEMINTAIEMTIDMFCHNEFNLFAKKAKDVAAGAVLIVSIGAVIIGFIVIIPKIITIITWYNR